MPEGTTQSGDPGDRTGDPVSRSVDALLPVVYEEIHELARAVLLHHRPIDNARTTSLIQDAYIKLAQRDVRFNDRNHFLRLAARAMRHVLIDRARRWGAQKRGGNRASTQFDDAICATLDDPSLLAIDEAMNRLGSFDERKCRIVELRFFGGLSVDETAEAMGLSPATVKREWSLAKAWLFREIQDSI